MDVLHAVFGALACLRNLLGERVGTALAQVPLLLCRLQPAARALRLSRGYKRDVYALGAVGSGR